ncbi:MAG: hypothetical protein K6E17_06210 [Clostridiales bacterium]|nr:hypothetical protein [Clostridiales bacterium]
MKKRIALITVLALLVCALFAGSASAADMRRTAVAYMNITFQCGCSRCGTGTMIASNGMITAGHNLLCPTHNKPVEKCNFYFNRRTNDYYSEYSGPFNYTYYCDFSNGYNSENDIGYIVFPSNVGNKTGWYGFSVESDDDLKWEYCHMYGYTSAGVLTADWNQIEVESAKQISWERASDFRDVGEGGPVYYDYEGLEYPIVVAVYTSHYGSTGYARRITNQIYKDMKEDGMNLN